MSTPLVLVEDQDGVRTLTLNAPQRLNALDEPLIAELSAAVSDTRTNPSVRAVVMTGAGRAFCAGADPTSLFGDLDAATDALEDRLMRVYSAFLGIRELTVPTIAAVHGPAVGAGLNVALCCDVLVAGPQADFGTTFAQIGLHPGGGCTWFLTERVGPGRAAAILLTGDTLTSDQAWQLGLVDVRSDDPQAHARQLAARIALRDPALNADIKVALRLATTGGFAATLAHEAAAQARSAGRPPFRRYVERFRARRTGGPAGP